MLIADHHEQGARVLFEKTPQALLEMPADRLFDDAGALLGTGRQKTFVERRRVGGAKQREVDVEPRDRFANIVERTASHRAATRQGDQPARRPQGGVGAICPRMAGDFVLGDADPAAHFVVVGGFAEVRLGQGLPGLGELFAEFFHCHLLR